VRTLIRHLKATDDAKASGNNGNSDSPGAAASPTISADYDVKSAAGYSSDEKSPVSSSDEKKSVVSSSGEKYALLSSDEKFAMPSSDEEEEFVSSSDELDDGHVTAEEESDKTSGGEPLTARDYARLVLSVEYSGRIYCGSIMLVQSFVGFLFFQMYLRSKLLMSLQCPHQMKNLQCSHRLRRSPPYHHRRTNVTVVVLRRREK